MSALTNLRAQLSRDEGRVAHAYQDSLGYWTIGVGHLIDKRRGGRLPEHIIDALLDHDIEEKTDELFAALPWVKTIDPARRATLINMAFQLGITGLLQFKTALGYAQRGEWFQASEAFLQSEVAREQTPQRWARHAEQLRTGNWV